MKKIIKKGVHMKNKQNYAVFTILLSIVITSCTANDKPFDSASETQTGEAVTAAVSTAEKIDSATETEKSISDTEVQTVPITETEAVTESMEKLDWVCGKTVQEERNFDTILKEDYDTPTVTWSSDERYAVVTESSKGSGEITIFDTLTNTMTSMPRLEIQNRIHAEVPDYVNLYCCDLLSYEWETDSILNVQFDMKTGVSFYHQSNMGWYTYDFENGSITALSYDIAIPEPTVNTMTEAEIKAVIDENLDILLTDGDEYYSEKEFIDAHPEAFEAIVALGEAALPYLKEIGDQYGYNGGDFSKNNRCFLAKAAEYVIKPDLYDMVVPSPNGKYAVKIIVNSFVGLNDPFSGIYYHLNLIDIETEANIIMIKDTFLFPWFIYSELPIKWSPDSKYVAVEEGYRYYYTVVKILDVQKADYINLPDKEDVELLLGKDLTYYDKDEQRSYSNVHFFISDWKTDAIKIQIILCDSARGVAGDGFYTYDLIKCEISYIEFDVDHIERK